MSSSSLLKKTKLLKPHNHHLLLTQNSIPLLPHPKIKPQLGILKEIHVMNFAKLRQLKAKRLKLVKGLRVNLAVRTAMQQGGLRSLCETLKHSKLSSSLKLTPFLYSSKEIQNLCIGLRNLRRLKTINLTMNPSDNIKAYGIRLLCRRLKRLRSLSRVGINLTDCSEHLKVWLHHLLPALRRLKILVHLNLNLSRCSTINDRQIKEISDTLARKYRTLNSIRLCCFGWHLISEIGVLYLISRLRKMKNLTCLNLCLNSIQLDGLHMKLLNRSLRSLPRLKHFSLQLCHSFFVTTLSKFPFESFRKWIIFLKYQKLLESLNLNFESCNFDDTAMKIIAPTFQHMQFLTDLKLNFGVHFSNVITDDGVSVLFTHLKHLKNLTTFHFKLIFCILVTNQGLYHICSTLQQLPNLQDLFLDMTSWSVNNLGAETLFRTLSCLNLSSLRLTFSNNPSLTDVCLESLSVYLNTTKSLSTLNLRFSSCYGLTKKGMAALSLGLTQLNVLKNLDLNFSKCHHMCDESIEILIPGLKALKSLLTLSLNFNECDLITKNGKKTFISTFKDHKNLYQISLELRNGNTFFWWDEEDFIRENFRDKLVIFNGENIFNNENVR